MTDMTFNEFNTVAPVILDSGVSCELISAPGRGKSENTAALIHTMAAKTGQSWGFATMFLATMTPSDLLGYMVPGVDNKGRRVSEFTMPPWMRTVDGGHVEDYERGILFLDEYGQGEADVKRASAELLLNRRLGPWQLPKGWSVMAASNRQGDRSGVTKGFDFVINRRVEVHIKDDIVSWEEWALNNKVDPLLVTFASQNIPIVFADGVPDKQGPWCTPRSLVMTGKLLDGLRHKDVTPDGSIMLGEFPTSDLAINLASGMMGDAATRQLFAMIKLQHALPSIEEIVANPGTCRLPERPDMLMLAAFTLASRALDTNIGAFVTYVNRFPPEYVPMWLRATMKYRPTAARHSAVQQLYMANASLFASVISVNR
jgi:hypothetical protein